MKVSNETKISHIGQPPGNRHMKVVGKIETPEPLAVYQDNENHEFYLSHKEIQALFGVRTPHPNKFLIPLERINANIYPNIAYGDVIDSGKEAITLFLNVHAYYVFLDSKTFSNNYALKREIFYRFLEYVIPQVNNQYIQEFLDKFPETILDCQKILGVSVAEDKETDKSASGGSVSAEADKPFVPTFKMFDDDEEGPIFSEPQAPSGNTTVPAVFIPDNSPVMMAVKEAIDKDVDTKIKKYKKDKEILENQVNSLKIELEVLSAKNAELSKNISACAVPNNVQSSRICYELIEKMELTPFNIYNVIYRAVTTAGTLHSGKTKGKYDQIWGIYNKKLEESLTNIGADLKYFKIDEEGSTIIESQQDKEDRKKFGPKKLNCSLYEYMVLHLGHGKAAIKILDDVLSGVFNDRTTLVETVKNYFRTTNTNAAIYWLRRLGVMYMYV